MLPAFVIGLREGLETVVILGAIAVFLRARGREELLPRVWRASVVAALLCLAAGLIVRFIEINLGWRQQEQLEAVVGALAVGTVTYMVVWMRRFPKDLEHDSASAASAALARDSGRALVLLAFFAVLREGFEIVVFVMATIGLSGDNSSLAGIGAVLGVVVSIAVGVGIVRGSRHLDVRRFFRFTAVVLVLSAAGIAMTTIHSANAAGWITFGQSPQFDLSWLAPPGSVLSSITTGMFGLEAYPVIIEVIVWVAYFVPMMLVVLWPRRVAFTPAGALSAEGDGGVAVTGGHRRRWVIASVVGVLAVAGAVSGIVLSSGSPTPKPVRTAGGTSGGGLLYATLEGITCSSASHCLAVGDFLPVDKDAASGDPDGDGQATHTLVEVSEGAAWRRETSPDAGKGGSVLNSIACPAANDCTAVGSYKRSVFGLQMSKAPPAYPLIEHYDGHSWRVVASPTIADNTTLASVSCPSVTDCVAVGADSVGLASGSASEVPVIEQYEGASWRTASISLSAGMSAGLTSVSCSSATACVAVGEIAPTSDPTNTRPLIEDLAAGIWQAVALPSGSNGPGILYDVSCPTSVHCVAVGTSGALRSTGAGLVLESDGSSWTTDRDSLQVSGDATFTAVGCSAVSDCVVVGTTSVGLAGAPVKIAERIEDGSWQPLNDPSDAGAVDAVACPSAGSCVGVGTRPVNDFGNTTVFVAGLDANGWQSLAVPAP